MTAKRFEINNNMNLDNEVETYELSCIVDNENKTFYFVVDSIANIELFVERLNELYEENKKQFRKNGAMEEEIECLSEENEQLKQDSNALIRLLESQLIIIQKLHSKLLEYQIKEPIVLTKEDLNLMGKAIGYYTHGRYAE